LEAWAARESQAAQDVRLFEGDCFETLKGLADNSIDSCVTDPPYALVSIGKRFGAEGAAPAQYGTNGLYQRASSGFMQRSWDTGKTAFAFEFWEQVLRVLKPGGYVAAFGGDRTFHRLVCAIEDAGFEIRHTAAWLHGQGFPKSLNLEKAAKNIEWCTCDD
jgi:site-specific DNA-methyltransferase (adenine-specific)